MGKSTASYSTNVDISTSGFLRLASMALSGCWWRKRARLSSITIKSYGTKSYLKTMMFSGPVSEMGGTTCVGSVPTAR